MGETTMADPTTLPYWAQAIIRDRPKARMILLDPAQIAETLAELEGMAEALTRAADDADRLGRPAEHRALRNRAAVLLRVAYRIRNQADEQEHALPLPDESGASAGCGVAR